MLPKLYYISQGDTYEEQLFNVCNALNNGIKLIQLRVKNLPQNEIESLAFECKTLCTEFGVPFIINDYIDIALKVNADGIHLGLEDESVEKARIILGDKIIGGTANTFADILKRIKEGCDYIGLGPFTHTITKNKLSPILGLKGYKEIISQLIDAKQNIRIYAIGGITEKDIEIIINTGVYGVAVSGMLTQQPEMKQSINRINEILNG